MAGFFDQLRNLSPEQNQGLLAAAAQILQQSGPSRNPNSIGQILGGGLQAYQGSLNQAEQQRRELAAADQQARLQGLRIQGAESDLNAQAKERDVANRINQAATSAVRNGSFDQEAFLQSVNQINPLKAIEFQRQLAKAGPEFDTKPQVGVDENGRPFTYIVSKSGQIQRLGGVLPREELKLANLGGRDVAYNPFQLTAGQTFERTQSPDSAASVAATIRGQNLTDARAREANQIGKSPAGYRWKADGSLEAIPGGPATKAATATEGERKAATLLKRLEGSESQLQTALRADAKADKPGIFAQGLRTVGAESAANTITPAARQRVEAAQLDILDAALTLGTGAAYTREQLEGYRRSYFPQIGDDPSTIADKQDRLKNVIDSAKIAAGRAAPSVQSRPAASSNGWSIQRVGE